jgi:hypothetical protein
MQRIGPGMYLDRRDGSLHFERAELCEILGVPPTEENCAIAIQCAWDAAREQFPDVTMTEVDR